MRAGRPGVAPGRQLGPLLEKLADEFPGRFVLVKANTVGLEESGFLEPEAEQLKAEAQFEYAEAFAGAQQYQQAWDIALSLVEQDRAGSGEAARQLMVNVFRVLPGDRNGSISTAASWRAVVLTCGFGPVCRPLKIFSPSPLSALANSPKLQAVGGRRIEAEESPRQTSRKFFFRTC